MAMNALRIRRYGGEVRSRTPSPMYLELNNNRGGGGSSKDSPSKDFAQQDFLNFHPVSSSEHGGSGCQTPRENTFGIHGICKPDNQANKDLPWDSQGDRDREVKQRQIPTETVLPAWERVSSTTPGTAPRPGYACDFKDSPAEMNVPLPRLTQRNTHYGSQGIPGIDLGQSLHNYANGSGGAYAGYPACDTEMQAACLPTSAFGYQMAHENEQVHMPTIAKGYPDRKAPARIMPPPPGLWDSMPPPPPVPTGFCEFIGEMVPSIGSRGHPHSCARACKYIWLKRGCLDGGNCTCCHFCRPNKAQTLSMPRAAAATNTPSHTKPILSVGSLGHPHSCAAACKHNGRKAGCRDGQLCNRCHMCSWTRATDKANKAKELISGSVGTEEKAMPPSNKFKDLAVFGGQVLSFLRFCGFLRVFRSRSHQKRSGTCLNASGVFFASNLHMEMGKII